MSDSTCAPINIRRNNKNFFLAGSTVTVLLRISSPPRLLSLVLLLFVLVRLGASLFATLVLAAFGDDTLLLDLPLLDEAVAAAFLPPGLAFVFRASFIIVYARLEP